MPIRAIDVIPELLLLLLLFSISLLVVRRDHKNITDTVTHIIVRIEDDINFVLSLSCLYESEVLIWYPGRYEVTSKTWLSVSLLGETVRRPSHSHVISPSG